MKSLYLFLSLTFLTIGSFAQKDDGAIQDSTFVKILMNKEGGKVDTSFYITTSHDDELEVILKEIDLGDKLKDIEELMIDVDVQLVIMDSEEADGTKISKIVTAVDEMNIDSLVEAALAKSGEREEEGNIIIKTIELSGDGDDFEIIINEEDDALNYRGNKKKQIKTVIRKDINKAGHATYIISDDKKKIKKIKQTSRKISIEVSDLSEEDKEAFSPKMPIAGKEKLRIKNMSFSYTDDVLAVKFKSKKADSLLVELFNENGDPLQTFQLLNFDGDFNNEMNMAKSGVYILKIQIGKKFTTRKIEITKSGC